MTSTVRVSRLTALLIAAGLAAAMAFTALDIVPAASQDVTLWAPAVSPSEDLMDPWSSTWGDVKPTEVFLSAQNATKPLGGGTVATLKARALNDGRRLYVMVEWKDKTLDQAVNGHNVFADATAVEFPATPGVSLPSFCMGDANGTVNVWHWKAVWQHDIEAGFASVSGRYPDGFADVYPFVGEDTFQAARAVGNILAQRQHVSPVENLVAASFGTLTTAEVQDVNGHGQWKDGRWRVVYSRSLITASGFPSLAVGDTTNIAFAVWDGSKGQRDGIKSVSQFLNLHLSAAPLEVHRGGFGWWVWLVVGGLGAVLVAGLLWAFYAPMNRAK